MSSAPSTSSRPRRSTVKPISYAVPGLGLGDSSSSSDDAAPATPTADTSSAKSKGKTKTTSKGKGKRRAPASSDGASGSEFELDESQPGGPDDDDDDDDDENGAGAADGAGTDSDSLGAQAVSDDDDDLSIAGDTPRRARKAPIGPKSARGPSLKQLAIEAKSKGKTKAGRQQNFPRVPPLLGATDKRWAPPRWMPPIALDVQCQWMTMHYEPPRREMQLPDGWNGETGLFLHARSRWSRAVGDGNLSKLLLENMYAPFGPELDLARDVGWWKGKWRTDVEEDDVVAMHERWGGWYDEVRTPDIKIVDEK